MAAYRRVYDSYHLQADCQETGSRVWATFRPTFFTVVKLSTDVAWQTLKSAAAPAFNEAVPIGSVLCSVQDETVRRYVQDSSEGRRLV